MRGTSQFIESRHKTPGFIYAGQGFSVYPKVPKVPEEEKRSHCLLE